MDDGLQGIDYVAGVDRLMAVIIGVLWRHRRPVGD